MKIQKSKNKRPSLGGGSLRGGKFGNLPQSIKDKENYKENVWYNHDLRHVYAKRALWSIGLSYTKSYKKLVDNIATLLQTESKRNNYRLCFEYLKDVYTVVMHLKAGNTFVDFKHNISLDYRGIPKIIPGILREKLLSDKIVFAAVITLLGIHRIIP